MVAVRCRPMNRDEQKRHDVNIVRVLDAKLVIVLDPETTAGHQTSTIPGLMTRSRERRYAFDHAFSNDVSTRTVYENTTRFLIEGVVGGFNATVFAYGCTGAGKTYTMLGTSEVPGLMALTLKDLFNRIEEVSEKEDAEFKVTLSYLEIYNESIRDLLTPSNEFLDLREDPIKGPTVAGISEVECAGARNVMKLLRRGDRRRTTEGTQANEASSRSHAVLQIVVEQKEKQPGTVANISVGKLSLIDLAGSERAAATQNRGIRLVEGANINRSLLALGNCINALCATSSGKGTFVPYRDSKLTRLLKDSLGGNCRTVMIANIGPSGKNVEETLNTLKYANRAKNIKTKVERNVLNVSYHMTEYVTLISGLRSEISTLKRKLSANNVHASLREHAEKGEISVLRNEVVGLFKERMQLRRSLIELEAQNLQNIFESRRIESELGRIENEARALRRMNAEGGCESKSEGRLGAEAGARVKDEGVVDTVKKRPGHTNCGEPPVPPVAHVATLRSEREQLRRATVNNESLKGKLEKRFRDNQRQANALRTQMQTRITGSERRELMELEYRVGMLELENMEVERHKILHRSSIAHRDSVIQKLLEQLQLRDLVIEEQSAALRGAGVRKHVQDLAHYSSLEPLSVLRALPSQKPPTTPAGKASVWRSDANGTPYRRQLVGDTSEIGGSQRSPSHDAESKRRPVGPVPVMAGSHAPGSAKRQKRDPAPTRLEVERPHCRDRKRRQHDVGNAVRKQHPYLGYLKHTKSALQHAETLEDSSELRNFQDDAHRNGGMPGDFGNRPNVFIESLPRDQKDRGRRRRSSNRKRASKSKRSRWRAKIKTYLSPALGRHCSLCPPEMSQHPGSAKGKGIAVDRASLADGAAQLPPIDCVYVLPVEGGVKGFETHEFPAHTDATAAVTPPTRNCHRDGAGAPAVAEREILIESSVNGHIPCNHPKVPTFTATRPAEAPMKGAPHSKGAGNGAGAVSPKVVQGYHRLSSRKSSALHQWGGVAGRRRARPRVKVKMIAPRDVPSPKPVGARVCRGLSEPVQRSTAAPVAGEMVPRTRLPASSVNNPVANEEMRHKGRDSRNKNREHFIRDRDGGGSTVNTQVQQGKNIYYDQARTLGAPFRHPQTDADADNTQPGGYRAQPVVRKARVNGRSIAEEKRPDLDTKNAASFLEAKQGVKKAPRSERQSQMRRVWGELEFILRQQIVNDADVVAAKRGAHKSLAFLDQIDALSTKTKLLRGQLSRWLMPYSENTSAFDQRALTPSSWASSPLLEGGHLNEEKYRQLIAGANALRSLVRIKIADDEDLNTARRAVKDAAWFFSQLNEETPYRDILRICT